VNEDGRFLNYYGGNWPTSPVWEFTTANSVATYQLSNVTHISGSIRAFEHLRYRMTVTNNGNERSEPNNITAYLVKSGVEYRFVGSPWGSVPALDPGQSTTTDVGVYFQDSTVTLNDGVTYNNIIATGANLVRFKSSPFSAATPQVSLEHTITYDNPGGPTVGWSISGDLGNKAASLGGKFRLGFSINDDVRTARVLLEYRPNTQGIWTVLDDFTGGDYTVS